MNLTIQTDTCVSLLKATYASTPNFVGAFGVVDTDIAIPEKCGGCFQNSLHCLGKLDFAALPVSPDNHPPLR